jgi:hypothetical protein
MASELDLKALREKVLLRETNAHIVDDKEAAACYRFILRQIRRGKLPMQRRAYRADLVALQREVLK